MIRPGRDAASLAEWCSLDCSQQWVATVLRSLTLSKASFLVAKGLPAQGHASGLLMYPAAPVASS